MKPCLMNKKRIALLAVDGLDAAEARALQEHLCTCPGCQQYSREVTEVCREQWRAVDGLPRIDADEIFHRRLRRRLTSAEASSAPINRAELLFHYFWRWRVALPVAVVIALSFVLLSAGRRSDKTGRAPVAENFSSTAITERSHYDDSPPTLSAYRIALSRSFEEFDELLNRNSARTAAHPEPVIVAALGRMPPE